MHVCLMSITGAYFRRTLASGNASQLRGNNFQLNASNYLFIISAKYNVFTFVYVRLSVCLSVRIRPIPDEYQYIQRLPRSSHLTCIFPWAVRTRFCAEFPESCDPIKFTWRIHALSERRVLYCENARHMLCCSNGIDNGNNLS